MYEFIEKIYARADVRSVPLCYQSIMICAIKEEMESYDYATLPKAELLHTVSDNTGVTIVGGDFIIESEV